MKSWVGWEEGDGGDDPSSAAYYSIERAISKSIDQDIIIVCVGEESNTEKPGDIRSLRLPVGQYQLVEGLKQSIVSNNPATTTTTTKIILVYFGGRPRLLETMVVCIYCIVLSCLVVLFLF